MSIDSARKFVDRMNTDDDFRKAFFSANDAKERLNIVKVAGFQFTEAEFGEVSGGLDQAIFATTDYPDKDGWHRSNDGVRTTTDYPDKDGWFWSNDGVR